MSRILINAVSAKSGGAATYIRNLVQELAKMEHTNQYTVYVPSSQAGTIQVPRNNIRIVETNIGHRSSWQRFFWDQVTLRRTIAKEKVDLLLSSSDFGMLFPPCRQILMIRNSLFFSQLYIKRFLPSKSRHFKAEFSLRRWLIALSVRHSDVVIVASESMFRDLKSFVSIPDGKAVVNYFGVPVEHFSGNRTRVREEGATDSGRLFEILYVSEYGDYKNLTTLLKAVLILREKGKARFCLTTTADPRQFPGIEIATREKDAALASHPLVAPFLNFTGAVSYEDIPKLYARSDLFVFPSLAESFAHPLVEAMASGLPIIASNIPVCREICGEAAQYFSPLDADELSENIELLWKNPDLRRRLGQIARHRAVTYFGWKKHVQRLVEIFGQRARRAEG